MITPFLVAILAAAPVQQADTTLDVGRGSRLTVENVKGSLVFRSWDRDQLRVRARSISGLRIDQSGSTVHIENRTRFGSGNIDLEITVPTSTNIDVTGLNMNVEVHDVAGDVTVEALNGNITGSGLNGRIRASTVQGEITIRDSRGDIEANDTNGRVTISACDCQLEVNSVNGPISLQRIRSGKVEAETVNGPIEYDGELRTDGHYDLSSHSGDVTLFVPEHTSATLSVETWRGKLDADFPVQLSTISGSGRLTVKLGGGGARVKIESFGGRVRLRRPSDKGK